MSPRGAVSTPCPQGVSALRLGVVAAGPPARANVGHSVGVSGDPQRGARYRALDEEALRALLAGTAAASGEGFFAALIENLARALGTHGAWVTEYDADAGRLHAIAFWLGGRWIEGFEYAVAGTPCEPVVVDRTLVHVPDRIVELYPVDPQLQEEGAVSYLGLPLLGDAEQVLGHLAVLDREPMPADPVCVSLFQVFAARAGAELRRLAAERELRAQELRVQALRDEAEALRDGARAGAGVEGVVGESPALGAVVAELRQVAETDATVLIQGETGTGKEVFARALHAASARRDRPLVTVNCGALPEALIESELFGHEKGAFTGAAGRRVGRFVQADGGTIFLDEVGELPLAMQVKLLRVLQEGEVQPVGGAETLRVDVRVVAATNRELHEAVSRGEFRGDLFFRLNVFPLRLPPLRARGDDVLLLAERFAARSAERLGRRALPLAPVDRDALRAYDWPGNVRELENVIERAVILARGGRLEVARLLGQPGDGGQRPAPAAPPSAPPAILSDRELRELERANLVRALEATGWKVAGDQGAAQLLGVSPSTLSSRMKALGIQRPRDAR